MKTHSISFLPLLLVSISLTAWAANNNQTPPTSTNTASRTERFLELFQPFRSENATLSPDGRYLAYSLRTEDKTLIHIVDVDQPGKIKTSAIVGSDADASPMFSENDEKTPLEIRWMHWVTPTRLVIVTNHGGVFVRPPTSLPLDSIEIPRRFFAANSPVDPEQNWLEQQAGLSFGTRSRRAFARLDGMDDWLDTPGTIMAIDADGQNAGVLLQASDLHRVLKYYTLEDGIVFTALHNMGPPYSINVFDFSASDPESLIISVRGKRYTTFFSINVYSGKLRHISNELGEADFHPLFDRQCHLRGGISGGFFSSPPFHYVLKKEKPLTLGRWKNIDEVFGSETNSIFTITSTNYFSERAFPVGFDENPDLLYYASNVGRNTYGLYLLNIKSGQRTNFAIEYPDIDLVEPPFRGFNKSSLVFDRFDRKLVGLRYDSVFRMTHWLKPELETVQKNLEGSFPYCSVEILEWDRAASRFLALVHNVSNPGSFVLFEPAKKRVYEVASRTASIVSNKRHSVIPFTVLADDKHKISGILTYPAAGRFTSVPIVVRCPTTPWLRAPREFQAESMAIAEMGFAVLQLDSRGAWGSGVERRNSIKSGYEKTLVEDILIALDKLATRFQINTQRVALIGEGYGGFVALRALQLAPERFRCAATIDAPLDLAAWMENDRWTRHSRTLELTRYYFGDAQSLADVPLLRYPEKITKPVCLLTFPGADGAPRTNIYLETRRFAAALKRQGTPVEINELDKRYTGNIDKTLTAYEPKSTVVELDREFAQRLPHSSAAVYRTIEYFLNAHIYDYQVKLGPLKELPAVGN